MIRSLHKHGFTLIELSIVLVIVALLIGGIVMGQQLIKSAETRKLLSELERYEQAWNAFKVKYNCIPGDCAKAASFNLGTNGNGDDNLGVECGDVNGACWAANYQYCGIGYDIVPWDVNITECQQVWAQMSAAGLIGSISPRAWAAPSTPMNQYYPSLGKPGSYIIISSFRGKTYIRTGIGSISGPVYFTEPILDGGQAASIAGKMGVDALGVASACPNSMQLSTITCPSAFNNKVIFTGYTTLKATGGIAGYYSWFDSIRDNCANTAGTAWSSGQCDLIWRVQ